MLLLRLNLDANSSIRLLLVSDGISFCFKACLAFFSARLEIFFSFLLLMGAFTPPLKKQTKTNHE